MMTRNQKEVDWEEEIREAFEVFDRNKDGTISATNLKSVDPLVRWHRFLFTLVVPLHLESPASDFDAFRERRR